MLKTLSLKRGQDGRSAAGDSKNAAKAADKAKKEGRSVCSKSPKVVGKTPSRPQNSRKRNVTAHDKGHLNVTPVKLPAVAMAEANLDNNCQSCLIFPEKDGSFILPTKESAPRAPEDELDQLVKNFHRSEREYIARMRKFTSYESPPMFPCIGPKKETRDRSHGEGRLARSPDAKNRTACSKAIRKVISEGPVKRIRQIYGDSVFYKKPKMVTAHYQTAEGETTPTRADSAAMSSFGPSGKSRFPREVFSLGSRCRRPVI
eukprot:TRINITY_DN2797_c0_g2_i1.p2 TRINITY_DN2797_c0_g2~~TRINITY_DN2797_c0_g2_i1.p2  ORF type:complete len:260 (+),score=69.73 TRINITY_DN2797_c0_g2_i1:653-1432(+)